ncbi:hypothetical protein DERF_004547 [Dermatophagoides farinae]|uniref:Uncharacterized protein n=1 Tax=Dermatophagoides farinae TaxID=6954 RepID=A0A922I7K5_DERFA|nr:hypothetical protein DERF_004547 [Dermatophagoides farinae]
MRLSLYIHLKISHHCVESPAETVFPGSRIQQQQQQKSKLTAVSNG